MFRLKHGSVEIEVAGESSFISETLGKLTDILRSFSKNQVDADMTTEPPSTSMESVADNAADTGAGQQSTSVPKPDGKRPTLAEFLNEKGPQRLPEQAACIAYYLEKFSGMDSFTTKDLTDWWKSSRLTMPGNLAQVVATACKKSYLNQVDNSSPFRYQLTLTGEKVVENMEYSSDDTPAPKRTAARLRKTAIDGSLKMILETPLDRLNLDKYPDIHQAKSVVQEMCWILLVYRNELQVDSLGPREMSQILSQKFGIKRSVETLSGVLSRNRKAFDRVGRGDYRLMKIGEGIAQGMMIEAS